MLTDKAKTDFEKWLADNYSIIIMQADGVEKFRANIPFVCEFALMTEWLDKQGLKVLVVPFHSQGELGLNLIGNDGTWSAFLYSNEFECIDDEINLEDRYQAIEWGVLKANELYNLKHQ